MDVIINPVSESVFNVSVTAASADFTALANTATSQAILSASARDGAEAAKIQAEDAADISIANSSKFLFLNTKKVVCFGDSITEDMNYPEQISTITGGTTYKIGFGGCRMARHTDVDYNELSMYKVAQSVASQNFTAMSTAITNLIGRGDDNSTAFNLLTSIDFSTVDLVTIWFGTNDFTSNEVTIGSSIGEVDTSIMGAINIIVRELCTAYPQLRIMFITPTHRFINGVSNDDSDITSNSLGLFLIDFVDGIISASNYNHFPVLDMHRESGFNKYNHNRYFVDGVHLNQIGYDLVAQKISARLSSLFKY